MHIYQLVLDFADSVFDLECNQGVFGGAVVLKGIQVTDRRNDAVWHLVKSPIPIEE